MSLYRSVPLSARAQAEVPPLHALPINRCLPRNWTICWEPLRLYPDPLLAELLPASTLPTQIVLADRYLVGGGDPNQTDAQPWDASVKAMAHYPSVLKWMDDNLNLTAQIGQAFLSQQTDVMASIQRLRATASKLGNLQSSPQQQVITDGSDIEIVPADPQVIYVPVYQPDQVYYDTPYGPPFINFGIGWPVGLWMDYDCDWGNGNLIFWGDGYARPANWWHESSRQRSMGHAGVWRSYSHPGAVAANRGDRGYGRNTLARAATPEAIRQELARPAAQHSEYSVGASRSAAWPVERAAPINRTDRAVRSSDCKVRKRREAIAIAANKACRSSPVPHLSRGQHPPAAVAGVGVATVVAAGVKFLIL